MSGRAQIEHVLLTTDAVGGVSTWCRVMADALRKAERHVTVLVLGAGIERVQADLRSLDVVVVDTGLQLDWVAKGPSELEQIADALRELACSFAPDVVHVHAPALVAAKRWPLPLAVSAHSCIATWWGAVRSGPLAPDLAWHARATHRGLAAADVAIAPSRSFARELEETYGGVHVDVVPNGLLEPEGNVRHQSARSGVLAAGRLWDPAKDIASLDVAAGSTAVRVQAAGAVSGPNGQAIHLRHIHHLGTLDSDRLSELFGTAALFVSTSVYEPFGLAVLEAAQRGAALVLSDIPAHRELWSDAAVFVPARRPDLLSEAITRVHADLALRERLAEAARERSRRYTAARMVERTLAAYDQALRHVHLGSCAQVRDSEEACAS